MSDTPEKIGCDCFDKVNEAYAESGYQLDLRQTMHLHKEGFGQDVLPIPFRKIRTGALVQKPFAFCVFCPICGTRIRAKQEPAEEKEEEAPPVPISTPSLFTEEVPA